MDRRKFLKTVGLASAGMLLPVGLNSWVAKGRTQPANKQRLIVIFLRGAIDGLDIVVPHQESKYYLARPTIAVPYPREQNGAIDLDGFFGLHPHLQDLMPLWKQGSLAFIHASGSPADTRSHFDAQDYMESGTPGIKNTPDGWMNRLLAHLAPEKLTQALNVGNTTPRILTGAMPIANLNPGKRSVNPIPIDYPHVSRAFDSLYSGSDRLSKAYQQGRRAREIVLKDLGQQMMSASRGAGAANNFIDDAGEVAKLMVGDAKTQLAFMEIGGWDTHVGQKNIFNRYLPALGEGLVTLVRGLDAIYTDTVIVVLSEFGRTVKENGNNGTDHGHGNVIWLLGGAIKGGRVYGEWRGLDESVLYERRDLPVTTDFREAIASILRQHMDISEKNIEQIFPGYQLKNNLNLLT